jgi:hypothetical protein
VNIRTFTQEFRASLALGDFVHFWRAAIISTRRSASRALQYGSDFRPYADQLIQAQSGGAFNLAGVESLLGAFGQSGALYGQVLSGGHGAERGLFGQDDLDLWPDRLKIASADGW